MRKRADDDIVTNEDVELIKYEDHTSDDEIEQINEHRRVLSIDELLEEAGGFGCLHLYTFTI
jgi:hypothetical protein